MISTSVFFGDNGGDYGSTLNYSQWLAEADRLYKMADEVQQAEGAGKDAGTTTQGAK